MCIPRYLYVCIYRTSPNVKSNATDNHSSQVRPIWLLGHSTLSRSGIYELKLVANGVGSTIKFVVEREIVRVSKIQDQSTAQDASGKSSKGNGTFDPVGLIRDKNTRASKIRVLRHEKIGSELTGRVSHIMRFTIYAERVLQKQSQCWWLSTVKTMYYLLLTRLGTICCLSPIYTRVWDYWIGTLVVPDEPFGLCTTEIQHWVRVGQDWIQQRWQGSRSRRNNAASKL